MCGAAELSSVCVLGCVYNALQAHPQLFCSAVCVCTLARNRWGMYMAMAIGLRLVASAVFSFECIHCRHIGACSATLCVQICKQQVSDVWGYG